MKDPASRRDPQTTPTVKATFSSAHWPGEADRTLSTRLAEGDPEAIMALYDDISAVAYGFALQLTRSRRRAYRALRSAFLHAIEDPAMFADLRVPVRVRILLEVNHYALHELPTRKLRRLRPGPSNVIAAAEGSIAQTVLPR